MTHLIGESDFKKRVLNRGDFILHDANTELFLAFARRYFVLVCEPVTTSYFLAGNSAFD